MPLTALSPLDGRYAASAQALAPYFSEWALIRYRLKVEIAWLLLLSERPECSQVRALSVAEKQWLTELESTFDASQAQRVKALEATIQHDVKAVEYYLKERLGETSMADMREWVHFCCTSEDISNLAYGVMLQEGLPAVWTPLAQHLVCQVAALAEAHREVPMLTRTHGQHAIALTLRNLGAALGYAVVAFQAILRGLQQVTVDYQALQADLDTTWEVLAEAVQTVMCKWGHAQPYEQPGSFSCPFTPPFVKGAGGISQRLSHANPPWPPFAKGGNRITDRKLNGPV